MAPPNVETVACFFSPGNFTSRGVFCTVRVCVLVNCKDMELIRKPSPMLPVVILIVVAPPRGHSVMHPVQAGAEHALWQVVFTSSLITTSK